MTRTQRGCLKLRHPQPNAVSANLPGSPDYNPSQPRMCKTWKGRIAAVIEAYGHSEHNDCKRAGSRATQIIQYLGQQDAERKYRLPDLHMDCSAEIIYPTEKAGKFVRRRGAEDATERQQIWISTCIVRRRTR